MALPLSLYWVKSNKGMKTLREGYNYLLVSREVTNTPEGKQREALLAQIKRSSMIAWHHIYMDGEYDFSDERVNTITKFPLAKILGLKLDKKQEG